MQEHSIAYYGFSKEMAQALAGLGYETLTEVQKAVIPAALAAQDIIVKSETGSGKTAAYAIPICEGISLEQRYPQALVLTPTRELAVQVKQDISNIGRFKKIRCAVIFGKQSVAIQRNELRQRVHVIVGTPGRLYDHIAKDHIHLAEIKVLIIDEADKMLEMGFIEQVEAIIKLLPRDRVTMLFSATMPEAVKDIGLQHMRNPHIIEVKSKNPTTKIIQQSFYEIPENEKLNLLKQLIYTKKPDRCIIFCNTREKVESLFDELKREWGFCGILHGGMEQKIRLTTMQNFKRGEFRFLIATDVAARGIHVDDISLIVNFDLPSEKESYVHRIGRTGRAGNEGAAITFITPEKRIALTQLEEYLHYKIFRQELPHLENIEPGKLFFDQTRTASIMPVNKTETLNQDIARIRINAGRKDKIRPGDILGAITAIAGVTAANAGIIDIQDTCSYVEILDGKGELVAEALTRTKVKGKIRTMRKVGFRDIF